MTDLSSVLSSVMDLSTSRAVGMEGAVVGSSPVLVTLEGHGEERAGMVVAIFATGSGAGEGGDVDFDLDTPPQLTRPGGGAEGRR